MDKDEHVSVSDLNAGESAGSLETANNMEKANDLNKYESEQYEKKEESSVPLRVY